MINILRNFLFFFTQTCQSSSENHLAQATEVLAQSVQLGLQAAQRELVAAACLELVECCGQFDQALASHYLALYQVSSNYFFI